MKEKLNSQHKIQFQYSFFYTCDSTSDVLTKYVNFTVSYLLAQWCLTALSAQTAYIVPYEYEIYHVGPGTKYTHHKTMKQYKGRLINKLQNGAIPLILRIGKIRNIRFVGNLILKIHRNFF